MDCASLDVVFPRLGVLFRKAAGPSSFRRSVGLLDLLDEDVDDAAVGFLM